MKTSAQRWQWIWLFYAVFGFLIYWNSLDNAFVFDDYDFIVNNFNIRNLFDWPAIWNSLSHPTRFITFLTFALNFHFGQMAVEGYHIVNTLIHVINAALVYTLCTHMFHIKPLQPRQSAHVPVIAFCAGLLFLVHPLQTQAVSYIAQRFTSLATLFYLIGVLSYLKYYVTGEKKYFVCLLVASVLGMFTKQIVFTLPILVVLLDRWLLKEKEPRFTRTQIGVVLLLLMCVPWAMRFNVSGILARSFLSGSHDGDTINALHYFLTQGRVIVQYLKLFVVPFGQTLDHDVALSTSFTDWRALLSWAVLLGALIFSVTRVKKYPVFAFCSVWFAVTISVTSSIIPIHHVMFEHRMYLPSVGLCLLVSYLLVTRLDYGKLYIPVMMIVVVAFSILTVQRNAVWDNRLLLWGDVVRKAPDKARGYRSLAVVYYERDEFLKALPLIQKAILLDPNNLSAYETRGRILYYMKDYEGALQDFNHVIARRPRRAAALKDRADVWFKQGKVEQALEGFNQAIALSPRDPHVFNARAQLYAKQGQLDLALADLDRAIQIDPFQYEFYNNRGVVHAMLSNLAPATKDFHKSLELNKNQPSVIKNLAAVEKSAFQK